MKTRKVGVTARYGARYGKGIRDRVKKTEKDKKRQKCPKCGKDSVKRKAYGVWECSKCGARFAGGAYSPRTDMGRVASRIIQTPEKAKELMKEYEGTAEKEEAPEKKPEEKPKEKKSKESE